MPTCGHIEDCDAHPLGPHSALVDGSEQRRPACLSPRRGAQEMPPPGARKKAESRP